MVHPLKTTLLNIYYTPGHGMGPRNLRAKEMYSKMEDGPQRSGQEACKYKKDCPAAEFSSWQV